eukprot:scaffold4223_cov189-Amphora_coffeaeformis.AAC.14
MDCMRINEIIHKRCMYKGRPTGISTATRSARTVPFGSHSQTSALASHSTLPTQNYHSLKKETSNSTSKAQSTKVLLLRWRRGDGGGLRDTLPLY